jgi:hypothetical protein
VPAVRQTVAENAKAPSRQRSIHVGQFFVFVVPDQCDSLSDDRPQGCENALGSPEMHSGLLFSDKLRTDQLDAKVASNPDASSLDLDDSDRALLAGLEENPFSSVREPPISRPLPTQEA